MKKLTSKYVCEYCKKGYSKESTLLVHMCEPKRRWLQKDEKSVQLGFYTFQRFYKLNSDELNFEHIISGASATYPVVDSSDEIMVKNLGSSMGNFKDNTDAIFISGFYAKS